MVPATSASIIQYLGTPTSPRSALTSFSTISLAHVPWLENVLPRYLRTDALRAIASRIRDDLDPVIAREGPHALDANKALAINAVLMGLHLHQISLYTIRCSRIHMAIETIRGKATRWPSALADQADSVLEMMDRSYGPMRLVRPLIFEEGGRLHNICLPSDITQRVRFRFSNFYY
jgi:hypothetical protein